MKLSHCLLALPLLVAVGCGAPFHSAGGGGNVGSKQVSLTNSLVYPLSGAAPKVVLTLSDDDASCKSRAFKKARELTFVLSPGTEAPTSPGMPPMGKHTFAAQGSPDTGSYSERDAAGKKLLSMNVTSGVLAVRTESNQGELSGDYLVVLQDGSKLSGSFHTELCEH